MSKKPEGLYFDAAKLHAPRGEYVLWCDGMGTGEALSNSLRSAANFIFKLHRALAEAVGSQSDVHVYPLMDGMYVTASKRQVIQDMIRDAFVRLGQEFNLHDDVTRHFLVRGGVAYGATIHGADVSEDAFVPGVGTKFEAANRKAFAKSTLNTTRSQLLLSSAMTMAYRVESLAPPFGVFVDDSALSMPQTVDGRDKGFPSRMWRWWEKDATARTVATQLATKVDAYFSEVSERTRELAYPAESLSKHKAAYEEYFRDLLP